MPKFTASNADRHTLYQLSVQNVEAEIDFVDQTFLDLRGRRASRLREDFCGTGQTSCEWVRRRADHEAIGLDIDQPTLDWGLEHNVQELDADAKRRLGLLRQDVRHPPPEGQNMDVVLAMNFSYWIFQKREELREYFRSVLDSLNEDGVFFLDHFGGYESMKEQEEEREVEGFTYVWDQHSYNPITGEMHCKIHFQFDDGSEIRDAFEYTWRLWTLPEIREVLEEAGFKKVTVYWEGTDDNDEDEDGYLSGNGIFEPTTEGEADAGFLCYITAEK